MGIGFERGIHSDLGVLGYLGEVRGVEVDCISKSAWMGAKLRLTLRANDSTWGFEILFELDPALAT